MLRQTKRFNEALIPRSGFCVDDLCRRCIRVFRDGFARQQKIDQVWNQKQSRRALGNARLSMRVELKERVEVEKLNSRARIYSRARQSRANLLDHSRSPLVAVTDGVFDDFAIRINKPIV